MSLLLSLLIITIINNTPGINLNLSLAKKKTDLGSVFNIHSQTFSYRVFVYRLPDRPKDATSV